MYPLDPSYPLRSSQRDIQPPPIAQEPNVARSITPYRAEDDDLLLPPFESVDSLDLNGPKFARSCLAEDRVVTIRALRSRIRVEELVDKPDLGGVGSDDPDILAAQVLSYISESSPNAGDPD